MHFGKCKSLELTNLPSGLTNIGQSAFNGCTNITVSNLPSGLITIGKGAFSGCTNITVSDLPNGLTTIGQDAFNGCTKLALTSLPESITSIGNTAFYGCTNITISNLPSELTTIGAGVFWGCTKLALTSLPESITSIGQNAFYGCSSLAITSIPSSVTSIGSAVFLNCTGLTTITIPEGITKIESQTFQGCSNLVQINLPAGITNIGQYGFLNCTNLATIYYAGTRAQWEAIPKGGLAIPATTEIICLGEPCPVNFVQNAENSYIKDFKTKNITIENQVVQGDRLLLELSPTSISQAPTEIEIKLQLKNSTEQEMKVQSITYEMEGNSGVFTQNPEVKGLDKIEINKTKDVSIKLRSLSFSNLTTKARCKINFALSPKGSDTPTSEFSIVVDLTI